MLNIQRLVCFTLFLLCIMLILTEQSPAQTQHSHPNQPAIISEDSLVLLNQKYDEAWHHWRKALFDLDIQPGMVIGEVGAGNGELAFLLAKQVGPEGHVYANEIDPSKLKKIREMILSGQVENVTPVLGQQNDAQFPVHNLDMVVLVEVYHHLDNPELFFRNMTRYLSDNSVVVIIDPDLNQPGGESEGCYSDPETTRSVFENAGYKVRKIDYRKVLDLKFYILSAYIPK